MISVICCYNKPEEYKAMCKTLQVQNIPCELIGVDNSNQRFSSAAAALNWGAKQSKGDILVFLHQDIIFSQGNSLQQLLEGILQTPEHVIVGIYGASHEEREKYVGSFQIYQTLDECCVAMPRKTWEKYLFNENLCDGWHLYVVELCLRVSNDGALICAKDCGILHLSTGTVDRNYMKTYRKILQIYKNKKWIATTCKSMPTNMMYYYGYYILWSIKKMLLGNYPLIHRIQSGRK